MTKEELKEKLHDLGIVTENYFPKSTFPHNGIISVGLYEREMREDFYFFAKYDKKIYKWKKFNHPLTLVNERKHTDYPKDTTSEKYMVPLSECEVIWEDKPFVEKPDTPYNSMTLRQYACIQLGVADSGLEWLDNLIKLKNVIP